MMMHMPKIKTEGFTTRHGTNKVQSAAAKTTTTTAKNNTRRTDHGGAATVFASQLLPRVCGPTQNMSHVSGHHCQSISALVASSPTRRCLFSNHNLYRYRAGRPSRDELSSEPIPCLDDGEDDDYDNDAGENSDNENNHNNATVDCTSND